MSVKATRPSTYRAQGVEGLKAKVFWNIYWGHFHQILAANIGPDLLQLIADKQIVRFFPHPTRRLV